MRIPRIHHPVPLSSGTLIDLEPQAAQHVARVLRMQAGDALVLFDGSGGQFAATIETVDKRRVAVRVGEHAPVEAESSLAVTLVQGISKGERMDYALQKAVELGVTRIVPVFTERAAVALKGERLERKQQHWQGVVIAACEQCGRNRLPGVLAPEVLTQYLRRPREGLGLVLAPTADSGLTDIPVPPTAVTLLIGPEGGLSDGEIAQAQTAGYRTLRFGPRVLRTETAAVAALSAVQLLWGDLG